MPRAQEMTQPLCGKLPPLKQKACLFVFVFARLESTLAGPWSIFEMNWAISKRKLFRCQQRGAPGGFWVNLCPSQSLWEDTEKRSASGASGLIQLQGTWCLFGFLNWFLFIESFESCSPRHTDGKCSCLGRFAGPSLGFALERGSWRWTCSQQSLLWKVFGGWIFFPSLYCLCDWWIHFGMDGTEASHLPFLFLTGWLSGASMFRGSLP